MADGPQYFFGDFCLDLSQKSLFRNNRLVPLTPKALETLIYLVENHGRVVHKEALIEAVWPDTFVEESGLARNVSALRKALSDSETGQSYIETIPKRGYRFVAIVTLSPPVNLPKASVSDTPATRVPGTAAGAASPSRSTARHLWLAVAAAAVALVAGAAYWLTASRPALSFADRDWVLIADTENRTGDPRFDKALLTALTVSMEQSRYANVVPRSRIYETLKRMNRPQDLSTDITINDTLGREICLRDNFRALLLTSLTRTGKEYLLIARLVDPKTGASVRSYTRKIQQEDAILDALDKIASDIRHDLGETLYSIGKDNRRLAKVTTSSLVALQHYSEADELWRKAKYPEARAQMEEALRIDPEFAMAHAALGSQFYSHIFSMPAQGKEQYERALQLSNRVTDRERMYIQASFAGARLHTDEAIQLYDILLKEYSDDSAARFNLATLFLRAGRCPDAIAQYQELIRIDPSDAASRTMIATCYANQGKYAEALPYYVRAFELDPARLATGNLNHEYGFTLAALGQAQTAREIFASKLQSPESRPKALRSLGLLDLYEGRYKEAAARFQEAVQLSESQKDELGLIRNRLYLATTLGARGDRTGEIRTLDQAGQPLSALQRVDWLAYRVGVAYARAGDVGKAERILQIAKQGNSIDDQASQSDVHRLQGEILLARQKYAQAILLLEQAHRENHPPLAILTFDSLARAYEQAGQLDLAISNYELMLSLQGGPQMGWEAQLPWVEAHYSLAKIYTSCGNAVRARELLDALLKIWKEADPDLPLLKETRTLRQSLSE